MPVRVVRIAMGLLGLVALVTVAAKQSPVYDTIATCNENQIMKYQSSAWTCQDDATGGGSLPSGIIVFTAGACPATWTEYTAARGYAVVGLVNSGTAAGTVGTALTNLQNKTHTHSVTVNALAGGTRKGGTSNPASIIENNNVPTASAGTASTSDVIPYIQLRACSKD